MEDSSSKGFAGAGKSAYWDNLDLKRHLNEPWKSACHEEQLVLARVIVSDWGGVTWNKQETLKRYVEAITVPNPPTPLSGIASYSKIFSIAQPEQFAIYGARVAACLNALQINAGVRKGIAFNYVPGRNNVVGNSSTKKGFTQLARFSVKTLAKAGWSRLRRDDTYARYIDVLLQCLEKLPEPNLADLEMALFANAECECQLAINGGKRPNG